MKILLKNTTIWTNSSNSISSKDIYIENNCIQKIEENINSDADVVIQNSHVSLGWVDTFAHFQDPGFESKETLTSGRKAAAAGGYTHVLLVPNTSPCVQTTSQIDYVKKDNHNSATQLHAIGASTIKNKGVELTEMYDMKDASAFGDGWHSLQDEGLIVRILQYLKPLKKPLFNIPQLANLALDGMVNESANTVTTGLKTIPRLAEILAVKRDIELVRYTQAHLHLPLITCAESIDLIADAKKEGLPITCGVSIGHLLYNDSTQLEFDSLYKMIPPFRSEEDRLALWQGLKAGTIDVICSAHLPQDLESKDVEFEYAASGMSTIQHCFQAFLQKGGDLKLWMRTQQNARKLLQLPTDEIGTEMKIDITIFDPQNGNNILPENSFSLGVNNPFFGQNLTGKILGVLYQNQITLF